MEGFSRETSSLVDVRRLPSLSHQSGRIRSLFNPTSSYASHKQHESSFLSLRTAIRALQRSLQKIPIENTSKNPPSKIPPIAPPFTSIKKKNSSPTNRPPFSQKFPPIPPIFSFVLVSPESDPPFFLVRSPQTDPFFKRGFDPVESYPPLDDSLFRARSNPILPMDPFFRVRSDIPPDGSVAQKVRGFAT